MTIRIADDEWDELTPENFDTTALLRAVDAVDELRGNLNDSEDGSPPQLRTDRAQPSSQSVLVRRRSGRPGARYDDLAGTGIRNAVPVDSALPRESVLCRPQ